MYASIGAADDGADQTAFRRAEKLYKLYYETSKKKKMSKQVDLSNVLDFELVSQSHLSNGALPPGVSAVESGLHRPVFSIDSHPGFYFIPKALSAEEQCRWIKESLTSFPQPPNRTNHNAMYGAIHDLFVAASENKHLVKDSENSIGYEMGYKWAHSNEHGDVNTTSVSASSLLRKLRWATLGLQFDWSMRNYNVSLPHNKLPDALFELAKYLATPSILPEDYNPDAAIVNYFGSRDTLGGHVDDIELDWNKPIVSISLGCKGIFLLGGKSRDEFPVAMFLRSGDVVLMAGEARECYHGVPRIFTDEENSEIGPLEKYFCEDKVLLDYVRGSRINVNIRQVS